MLVIINGLKIVLLALVITYVIFHLGEYVNSLQVKRFKEKEDADKIIIPEKDICDTCKYLGYYGIDDNGESDYYCEFGHCHFKNAKDRCDRYSPSNLVKKSDITQVTVSTDFIHDATDKECNDDMFDIRPLLNSVSITDEDVKQLTARWIRDEDWDVPLYRCSECNHMSAVMTNYCPGCHSIMIGEQKASKHSEWLKVADWDDQYWTCANCGYSVDYKRKKCPNCNHIMDNKKDTSNKEKRAEWKKRNRHGNIVYECSHCGNWSYHMTKYCSQCNYPMEAGWKAWFVEHD